MQPPTRKPLESADTPAPRQVNLLGYDLAFAEPDSSACLRTIARPPRHRGSPVLRLVKGFA
jgi:hypothetical protein